MSSISVWRAGPRLLSWAICGCLALTAGCDAIKQIALQTAPQTEKVTAEFSRLPGHKALVFVWVPPEVKWDYPYLRVDVAAHVSAYLSDNLKDVSVVDPRQVEDYIARTRQAEMDPVAVGKHFQADMVVYLAIYHFSVRDPGMAHYYRGRMSASVEVQDLTGATPERFPLRSVESAYPEKDPISFATVQPEQIREATYQVFTTEVGRKFHEYERPLD